MLTTAVLLPSALTPTGAGDLAAAEQALCLTAMSDLADGGVVVYSGDEYPAHVRAALAGWEPRYAAPATKLLTQMAKRRRFIVLKPDGEANCPCGCCSGGLRATAFADVKAALCGGLCCGAVSAAVEVVRPPDYPVSQLRQRIVTWGFRDFGPRETTQGEFENAVLAPVLRHAKRVTLYDRNIGAATAMTARPVLPARYAETIAWFARAYRRYGTSSRRRFVVLTGLGVVSGAGPTDTRDALQRAAARIASDTDIDLEIALVDDGDPSVVGTGESLRHGRYLSTDQVTLLIERGFDLLMPVARGVTPIPLRDFAIHRLSGPASIDTHISRLGGRLGVEL